MFLFRLAVLAAAGIMLMPNDPADQARVYQTASYALGRAVTFCDRNAAVCRAAEGHWASFREKVSVAARMATQLAQERMTGGHPTQPARSGPDQRRSLDTLEAADRQPPWHGMARTRL
jgi:hypothetical protein